MKLKQIVLLMMVSLFCSFISACHAREAATNLSGKSNQIEETLSKEITHNKTGYQPCQPNTTLPVTLFNGNLIITSEDMVFPGRGLDMAFHRIYNSRQQTNREILEKAGKNICGRGWTTFLDQKVIKHTTGGLSVYKLDGGMDYYELAANGGYITPRGVYTKIKETSIGFAGIDKNGNETVYAKQGEIISIKDRNNNQITVRYKNKLPEEIVDTVGRVFKLDYNTDGKLWKMKDPAGREWRYFYNENQLLVKVTNSLRKSIRYEYDAQQRLVKYMGQNEGEYGIEYNSQGKVTRLLDPLKQFTTLIYGDAVVMVSNNLGRKTNYYFDGRNRIKAITGSLKNEVPTTHVWDDNNNLLELRESGERVTRYQYDSLGNILVKKDALDQVLKYQYQKGSSRPVLVTDPQNNKTLYKYDKQGNLIEVIDALGRETKITYNQYGKPIEIINSQGHATRIEYNELGEVTRRIFPDNTQETYSYNKFGKISKKTNAAGEITRFEYDRQGQLAKQIKPAGNSIEYEFDAMNNLSQVKDPKGNSSKYEYDVFGNVVTFTNPLGYSTQYTYETADNLLSGKSNILSITDPKNNKTLYLYDDNNQLIKITYPDGSSERLEYDRYGNVISQTDRNGKKQILKYDKLNRLIEKQYADQAIISYTYNWKSQIEQINDGEGILKYIYDDLGRIENVTDHRKMRVSYYYAGSNNISRLTYPDGYYLTYSYDASDRLVQISDPAGKQLVKMEWDELSRRKFLYLGENIRTSYLYYNTSWIKEIKNYFKGKQISFVRYDYDEIGNVTRKYSDEGMTQYIYDDKYQVIQAGKPDRPVESYQYDALGNRVKTKIGNTKFNYQANSLNQYMRVNSSRLAYDQNGNLVLSGSGKNKKEYKYDLENRLLEIRTNSGKYAYSYDGFGRRTKRAVNDEIKEQYVYAQHNIIADLDNQNNIIAKYVYAPGVDDLLIKISKDKQYYYLKDAQKSISAVMDETGILEKYTYDTFGQPAQKPKAANRYLFTGREYDRESGLYYFRARHYDPVLGRFIQSDPIGYYGGQNLYEFAENNSVNYMDPFGLYTIVLNNSNAVPLPWGYAGHSALLVGDDVRGWHYFSKDGKQMDVIALKYYLGQYGLGNHLKAENHLNTHPEKPYPTLGEFFAAHPGYDRVQVILTDPATDTKIIEMAKGKINGPYILYDKLFGDNCWGFDVDILNVFGIPTGDRTIIPNVGFERADKPIQEYNKKQKEYARKAIESKTQQYVFDIEDKTETFTSFENPPVCHVFLPAGKIKKLLRGKVGAAPVVIGYDSKTNQVVKSKPSADYNPKKFKSARLEFDVESPITTYLEIHIDSLSNNPGTDVSVEKAAQYHYKGIIADYEKLWQGLNRLFSCSVSSSPYGVGDSYTFSVKNIRFVVELNE